MNRPDLKSAAISQAVAGTTTVVAAVTGKSIVVESVALVLGASGTAKFRSGSSDDVTGAFSLAANGGLVLPAAGREDRWFKTAPGEDLVMVTTGGAGNGCLSYRLEYV